MLYVLLCIVVGTVVAIYVLAGLTALLFPVKPFPSEREAQKRAMREYLNKGRNKP